MAKPDIFIGTDSGATTSKTGGIFADGTVISQELRQSSTNSKDGTAAVIAGWVEGVRGFLVDNEITWDQVRGVGLALPGPYQAYGVLDKSANLPASFEGWNFLADYTAALSAEAGRPVFVATGNDGDLGGVGEAHAVRGDRKVGVILLAPGSGLGCAYVNADGLHLGGDNFAGMEAGHMPAPLHLLGNAPVYECGCGKGWGCIEAYTTISGLPQLLRDTLKRYPDHELHQSELPIKQQCFSLRDRAQVGDPLALDMFDFQAKALGLHAANLITALDPAYVVIGGGLIDPESTTPEFRKRYLDGIRDAALPYLFPAQRANIQFVPATLGELSQSIGAALLARHRPALN
ncbi:ROK family protein [Synoicihabitans lomoniglobus]|uniref:ROK family protein n=1 Tax=Synoicihabitans lomoniglobus TaxID=2909285 RepID=A0AAF0CQN0_9BACT|nr:ROK family protein [Opitutaceae bacterium LMO-M01]WED66274.1 ROK family protein [Opitutaceae bacterium LMO-M01]